jgi:threonine/homoserine/homoserine lactone efflux protein
MLGVARTRGLCATEAIRRSRTWSGAQVAILAITSVSIEFCILAGYGALAGRVTHLAARPRFAKLTNRVAGSMLITAGVGMASLKKA